MLTTLRHAFLKLILKPGEIQINRAGLEKNFNFLSQTFLNKVQEYRFNVPKL